jgi:3-hydroxybutyryl-CoA dehydratase
MEVSCKIKLTKELVYEFSEVSGDRNPIHINEKYAKESKFGNLVVHGMLLGSFFSKLIAEKHPGPGSIYVSQTINFVLPVYVGETVTVIVKETLRQKNKYFLLTEIINENGDKAVVGLAEVIKNI